MTSEDVSNLAKRYVDHITNDDGGVLANVYEAEGFKSVYDPNGVQERKLRLPRTLLQIHNRMCADK